MTTLTTPIDGLLATPVARLPYQANVVVRSFVLDRADGPTIVYNSPGVSEAADDIRAVGTPTRLLVNHAHEAMYGAPGLDVPVWVHERDARETAGSLPVAGTFSGRTRIGDDLEAIPTPGHTAGTTSYLWDAGSHRFLFTGDFLWIEHGEWKAVVLDAGLRGAYLESLALVRDLDFDVLVPWGVTDDSEPVALVEPGEARRRIDAVLARIEAGGSR